MKVLRYSLVSDGPSDRVLLRPINWLLERISKSPFYGQWVDFRWLPTPPQSLPEKIAQAIELQPCDLLFVHRDAEGAARTKRVEEIRKGMKSAPNQLAICVVPIRMQEAWFMFDEAAIRTAADNPNGKMELNLPCLRDTEGIPDPKSVLRRAIGVASGLGMRRRRMLAISSRLHRVADLIEDFSPLRNLPAFRELESDLRTIIQEQSW